MAEAKKKTTTGTTKKTAAPLIVARVVVYQDHAGEWRWSAVAKNGKKVADSSEGYGTKRWAVKAAGDINKGVPIDWGRR